ncbi:MAG: PilZ domain-containing protein [Terriglobales bacterium]|jgi:hypothetical protein
MPDRTETDDDRRRSPRFSCGGGAEITHLPANGIFRGALRDLSLHGCCVDSTLLLDCGARAELVVRVNAASFRALGEVRAIRGRSGAGMEFVRLSAGGRAVLADLIAELERFQAAMKKLKPTPHEMNAGSFREQLEEGRRRATMLRQRFPILGSILSADGSEESVEADEVARAGQSRIVEAQPVVIRVDLFG